ncbi:TPR domain-containing protein [Fusarium denticulatum]|uniref:TPR domain-containing protein n=1 Tax=Fusarium denticulatum TaxID=48507 RepID=A0A8H5WYA1_9HYPO|nr:TPR domain-containing protein [Fusarium denticulatum]
MENLQEQIQIVLEHIEMTAHGHPLWAQYMSHLSDLKYLLYHHTADALVLDDSISTGIEAIRATDKDDPSRGGRLCKQASRLECRYSVAGATVDLEDATRLTREALQLIPPDHPGRATALISHGSILNKVGSPVDLEEAATVTEEATSITEDREILYEARKNLDSIFYAKYCLSGEVTDLEQSIQFACSAISLLSSDTKQQAMYLGNLFTRQREFYLETKTSDALDEAVRTANQALNLTSEDDPYYAVSLTNFGTALFNRWELYGERVNLEDSIQIVRSAIALLEDGDPLKAIDLRNLTDRLGQKFVITRAVEDLRECVKVAIQALDATPMSHPEKVPFYSNVALRLATLYKETRDSIQLKEAIEAATQALSLTKETDSWWGQLVNNLAYLLSERYSREGLISDLQEAVRLAERCIEMTSTDHESYSERLISLADFLRERYNIFGVAADIHKAVALGREALAGLPHGHADWNRFQSYLGLWLGEMFLETGLESDLEEGIQLARQAYDGSLLDQQSDSDYSTSLSKLLFLRRGTGTDSIDEAIQITKRAIAAVPEGDPNHQVRLMNLSTYLGTRYRECGESSDLDEAIRFAKDALDLTERSTSDYFEALNNISTLLGMRYSDSGSSLELTEAIQLMSEALEVIGTSNLLRPKLLNSMANRMRDQYSTTRDLTTLEDAIRLAREASKTEFERDKSRALRTLGTLLGDRFLAQGEISDINNSIEILQRAIADTPTNHPDRSGLLSNLGIRLGDRYTRTREIKDLDEAIQHTREAVSQTPRGHVEFAARSSNLAARLGDRYTRIGRLVDLHDAISIGRNLLTPDSLDITGTNRSAILNNLGIRLNEEYARTGLLEVLDDAIRYATEAVDALPPGHLDLAVRLKNLGTLLNERYIKTAEDDDYINSMDIGKRAIQAAPLRHPLHSACLSNMGCLFFIKFRQTGGLADLEQAIQTLREAMDSCPKDHPDHAERLVRLGDGLAEKYVILKDLAMLDESISCFRSAARQVNAPLSIRIRASRQLLRSLLIRSQWKEAFKAAEEALDLIPELVLRSLDNSDKQYLLGQVAGLACEAASTAIRGGNSPMTALGLLEKGRGILATTIEDMRTDVEDLHSNSPELANRFVKCKEEFYSITNRAKNVPESTLASHQYECERRFDDVVKEIRSLSGFEDFLLEPSASKIRAVALQGPIIVINISMFDCGAIVMNSRGEYAISLPRLTKNDLERRVQSGNLDSLETLEWLWDVIANPILDHLGLTNTPTDQNWTHIWWIPTGALCKFPLHAAGYHLRNTGETVMDRAISSYSSSVKALILYHRAPIKQPTAPTALLVALENTTGCASLPFARQEVDSIRGICSSMNLTIIEPKKKRKADIQPYLQGCSIFHFAGHGHTDETNPSLSHLLLEEGQHNPLTVGELLEMNLRDSSPFLAYLPACGTGRYKDEKFADESLHLIGACQVAGFRHVIGTLWEVQDRLCMDVARGIYESIRDKGMVDTSVSHGLHNSIRRLRDIWLKNRSRSKLEARNIHVTSPCHGLVKETGLVTREKQPIPRDIIMVEDEGDGDLHWVPYIHFGV